MDNATERGGAVEIPVHCTTAEGELMQGSGELPSLLSTSSCPDTDMEAVNELSVCYALNYMPGL